MEIDPIIEQIIDVLNKRHKTAEEIEQFLQKCVNAEFKIFNVETKPGTRSPSPPFTTSTLQQEASRKLGFSVAQTMTIAQKLYEAGFITYMRTDSVNLSQEAINGASSAIQSNYGDDYLETRQYKTKSGSAQEAHEAIRPTNFANQEVNADRNGQRLYELIWKRAIASQMANARIEKTIAKISVNGQENEEIFEASGEVIKFEGFLKVYIEGNDDEDDDSNDSVLPPLHKDQILNLKKIISRECLRWNV